MSIVPIYDFVSSTDIYWFSLLSIMGKCDESISTRQYCYSTNFRFHFKKMIARY
jgi:hypothetical protein